MKIEFELDPDRLKKTIEYAVGRAISINYDGELRGSLAGDLTAMIQTEVKQALAALDLRAMIAETIERNAIPTIGKAINDRLKVMAREAVKAAMAEAVDET